MDELKDIFAVKLHDLLKSRIVGSVFVKVIYDTIIIRINSFDNFYYKKEIHNFSSLVNKGTSASSMSKLIIEDYRSRLIKELMKKYFINKKEEINDLLYLPKEQSMQA